MLSRAIFDGLVQTSYESDRETTSGCESREQRQTKQEFPYFCRKRVFRAWPLNIVLDYNPPTFAGVIWVLRVSSAYLLPNKALLLSSPCCHNEYCFQAWNDGDNHVKWTQFLTNITVLFYDRLLVETTLSLSQEPLLKKSHHPDLFQGTNETHAAFSSREKQTVLWTQLPFREKQNITWWKKQNPAWETC